MAQEFMEERDFSRTNGTMNGHPRGGPTREEEEAQTDENIFLFIPNLIGEWTL